MSDVHDVRLYHELDAAEKSASDVVGHLIRAMRLLGEKQHHIERLEGHVRLLEAKLKGLDNGRKEGSTEAG